MPRVRSGRRRPACLRRVVSSRTKLESSRGRKRTWPLAGVWGDIDNGSYYAYVTVTYGTVGQYVSAPSAAQLSGRPEDKPERRGPLTFTERNLLGGAMSATDICGTCGAPTPHHRDGCQGPKPRPAKFPLLPAVVAALTVAATAAV